MMSGSEDSALCTACAPSVPLDPFGNHASACRTGAKARYDLHSSLCKTIAKFARLTGASVSIEPATHNILLNKLSPAQCRTLFPKNAGGNNTRASTLRSLLHRIATLGPGPDKTKLTIEAEQFATQTPLDVKGLRLDIDINFDDTQLCIDVGGTHPTTSSSLRSVSTFTHKLHESERKLGTQGARNEHLHEPSPNVKRMINTKNKRYTPLMALANQQCVAGFRKVPPRFFPCIVSHLGEFSPDLMAVVETITKKYGATVGLERTFDGVPLKRKTGTFRSDLKSSIIFATARGFGRALLLAGRPWAGSSTGSLDSQWTQVPRWFRDSSLVVDDPGS